tara:strand:- start:55 stop:765 length:711 start_codon:yes stop_codon:yes gene_type:complete
VERLALITGSSSGIGKAVASKLLSNDFKVIGLARDHTKYSPDCSNYLPITVDLSDVPTLEDIIPDILKKHGTIDVFISNAGFGNFKNLENFSPSQIQKYFNVNLIAQIVISHYVISQMKKAGKGDILIIGSEAALAGKRKSTLYSAAKFGLRGFSQSLRDEVGASGVRVCLINPGLVRSPFFDQLSFEPGNHDNNAILPEDVAKIVLETLNTRRGTIIDEINLSPATTNINAKTNN